MEYFELLGAMKAKAPVVTRMVEPTYTTVVVGCVVGVTHRLDPDDREIIQVEIKERKTNSVIVAPPEKVEPLWEVAKEHG